MSAGFYERHPVELPLTLFGATTDVTVNRGAAAVLVATVFNQDRHWAWGKEFLEQAEPGQLATALQATFAFNLNKYDDVLHVTRWLSGSSLEPLDALGLILRGCALRELGKPFEARMALDGALRGASNSAELADLHQFEMARTWAASPHGSSSARAYLQGLHSRNPNLSLIHI